MTTQLFKSLTYIIVVLFFSSMAHAENMTFNFSEGRPVEAAADKLEEVYSLPISYEDPLYENDTELKNTLSFSYEVPAADATEDTVTTSGTTVSTSCAISPIWCCFFHS
jgi:hypothetical protein